MTERSMKPLIKSAVVIMAALTFATLALAQGTRVIKGKVTNDKGEVVVDAKVEILGMDIKRTYRTKTNKKGEYFYMGIPMGLYRVIIRAEGYQPDATSNVRPTLAEHFEVDFQLKPGQQEAKLSFEMTQEDIDALKKKREESEKQRQVSKGVKEAFDAGLALAQVGKNEEALAEYQKALSMDAEQPYIQANMAQALSGLGRNEEAIASYEQAIALNPDDANFYTNMGVILGKMGKTAESEQAFEKAVAMNPGGAATNFFNLGATLVNVGNTNGAVAAFRKSVQADPNYAEAYYQLGICLSGSPATIPEAVEAFQKYIEIGENQEQVEVAKQLIEALKATP